MNKKSRILFDEKIKESSKRNQKYYINIEENLQLNIAITKRRSVYFEKLLDTHRRTSEEQTVQLN